MSKFSTIYIYSIFIGFIRLLYIIKFIVQKHLDLGTVKILSFEIFRSNVFSFQEKNDIIDKVKQLLMKCRDRNGTIGSKYINNFSL